MVGPRFLTVGWYFTENGGEEAKMIDVVMDYRRRNQYEGMVS